MKRLAILLIILNFAHSPTALTQTEPLPLELAFSKKVLPVTVIDQPAMSNDGRYIAYTILNRDAKAPESNEEIEPRIYSNGMPRSAIGLQLFVSDIVGGEKRAICDESSNCLRPSWSPDGKRLAYYSDASGFPQVYVYDVATSRSELAHDVKIKVRIWPGDAAIWSPDGREIYIPINLSNYDTPSTTKVVSSSSRSTVRVYETSANAKKPSTDGTLDLTSNEMQRRESNATLGVLDLDTRELRILVTADAHPYPTAMMRLSPDGKWLSYISVAKGKGGVSSEWTHDLAVVSSQGGAVSLIASELEPNDSLSLGDATYRWLPDSSQVLFLKNKKLWLSDVAGAKTLQLSAGVGLLTNELLLLTADGKMVVVELESKALALISLDGSFESVLPFSGNPIRADQDTLWQLQSDFFFLLSGDAESLIKSILKIDMRTKSSSQIWKGTGRFNFVGTNSNNDIIAIFESFDMPRDIYGFDQTFSSPKRISQVETRLAHIPVGSVEIFTTTIPGLDGTLTQVQSAIVLPPNFREPVPAIVQIYPGSSQAGYAGRFAGGAPGSIPTQLFTSRGYALLLVDIPLVPMGKTGNPIQEMTDALLPQVYHAIHLGYIDVEKIAIMGQSYGGYGTAAVISQTNLFRAAIAMAGMYDLPGNYGADFFNRRWSETGQGRMGTSPWNDLRRYLANSPYYHADKINTPLLLIHGKKDPTCPVGEAVKLLNALDRLGKTAELAVYEGEGHVPGDWSVANAVDATLRMLDFLSKHRVKRSST